MLEDKDFFGELSKQKGNWLEDNLRSQIMNQPKML